MNIQIIFLTVAILLIGQTSSAAIDTTEISSYTTEIITSELTTTPEPTTTTILTTTTTTTTTTPAPEFDREWEDLVLAGPTVVNYLSLFMVTVSRGDQVLTPPDGYTVKYIQNINSLRAILVQISSAMQNTFQLTRDDLVRIQNSMQEIPDHIIAGLTAIKLTSHEALSSLLSYTLRNLERAANEGSTVSKPTLNRFISVGLLLEELVTVLASTLNGTDNADYLIEANAYAEDISTQWNLLIDLFKKFSERADITQSSIINNYIDPIDEALKTDGFSTPSQIAGHLSKLVPVAITIDQSSYLLDMMVDTYSKMAADDMDSQIIASTTYLGIAVESERATNQRQLWQNIVSTSVDVARRAQRRHDQFVETGPAREAKYAQYLDDAFRR